MFGKYKFLLMIFLIAFNVNANKAYIEKPEENCGDTSSQTRGQRVSQACYDYNNIIKKEMHIMETHKPDYEGNGIYAKKQYGTNTEKNGVQFVEEQVAEYDIIPCESGEENLSSESYSGIHKKRKMHDMMGIVGENYNGQISNDIKYDMTSIKGYEESRKKLVEGYRKNVKNGRYCRPKSLSSEYDVPKEYCEAGQVTPIFYSGYPDAYGRRPQCQLTLDTNIKIEEIRYLRQVVAPETSTSGNYSIGNGIVKCVIKNGIPKIELFSNPHTSTSCDSNSYKISPCCNPVTGFGCDAQYCQYGADKHCKGQNIPNIGSCVFKSKTIAFVKDEVTFKPSNDPTNTKKATFSCQENGSWKLISHNCN